jgi:hypothetical protein
VLPKAAKEAVVCTGALTALTSRACVPKAHLLHGLGFITPQLGTAVLAGPPAHWAEQGWVLNVDVTEEPWPLGRLSVMLLGLS